MLAPPPHAFRIYPPALARQITRRARPLRPNTPRSPSTSPPTPTTASSSKSRPSTTTSLVAGRSVYADQEASSIPLPPRPYTFHIGASWAGKPPHAKDMKKVPFPPDTLIGAWRDRTLGWKGKGSENRATQMVVDPGEDFFFVQEVRFIKTGIPKSSSLFLPFFAESLADASRLEGVSFGVADGVGGWVDSGVDPALFSQALMYHAHRYSRNAWAGEPEIDPTMDYEEREQIEGWEMTPYECLDLAYGGVLREKYVQAGSSTACIISLNASSGVLRSANLGDSGFLILRQTSLVHRQAPQTHFFNCPKQLTKLPTNNGRRFSRACVDSPSEAETYRAKLRDGDIVIVYTDGLADNVFQSEMMTICSLVARTGGTEDEQVQAMADRLVDYARQCMKSKSRVSPFEREASRVGMYFRGGKPDDVTVIVALVRETS
ncbi:hypothetical protein GALMADRAFT_59131 [Galerina marginata CBS 339.88]|uniref:Protein phosphatase n=1 Tax=Galerina marginata (strain CBS 339.88) TaxID=685588 RepID=A0A067TRK5_GALM3|nr:hypothetical protein GALMADRAFT_59131 [Galerina marginata CBS 339.88]